MVVWPTKRYRSEPSLHTASVCQHIRDEQQNKQHKRAKPPTRVFQPYRKTGTCFPPEVLSAGCFVGKSANLMTDCRQFRDRSEQDGARALGEVIGDMRERKTDEANDVFCLCSAFAGYRRCRLELWG